MAIDTAEKRRAAAGIPFFVLGPGVTPNVAKDVEWRQESGWGYPGIAPPPPTARRRDVDTGLGQRRSFSDRSELGGGGW